MKCSVQPYEGEKPFLFFSYCHADSARVYPLIEALAQRGFRIWYDSGITIGDEWPEVIAQKLEKCAAFLPAITPAYCRSHNCKNELTFQVEDKKLILPLKMDEFPLIGGIRLQLANTQMVQLCGMAPGSWADAIAALEQLKPCLGEPVRLTRQEMPKQEKPEPPKPEAPKPKKQELPKPAARRPEEKKTEAPEPARMEGTVADDPALTELAQTMPDEQETFLAVQLWDGQQLTAQRGRLLLGGCLELQAQSGGSIRARKRGDGEVILAGSPLRSDGVSLSQAFTARVSGSRFAVFPARELPWLRTLGRVCLLTAEATGEERLLGQEGLQLGRAYPWLQGSMCDPRISHKHGEIFFRDGAAVLRDHSKNGTYINGVFVSGSGRSPAVAAEQALTAGDAVRLGRELFRYQEVALQDEEKLRQAYAEACAAQAEAKTWEDHLKAAERFEALGPYRDSEKRRSHCADKAEECRKDALYAKAAALADRQEAESLTQAISLLGSLKGWRDSAAFQESCEQKLSELKAKEQTYQKACALLDSGETVQVLAEAERLFASLGNFRDSGTRQLHCRGKAEQLRRALEQAQKAKPAEEDAPTVCIKAPPGLERLLLVDMSTGEVFWGKAQSTVIGRKVNQCDVPFPGDERLSRRHAEVFARDGKYYVRDCHSANGTVVNGRRLDADQTVQIGEAAILNLAKEELLAVFDAAAERLAEQGCAALLQYDGGCRLITEEPAKFVYVDPDKTVVDGFTPSACAALAMQAGKAVLRVYQSECVRVDGRELEAESSTVLRDGAELNIGGEIARFRQLPLVNFQRGGKDQ